MPVPGLSLIIPCYNEAGRVELLLKGLAAFDRQWTGLYEILLVDDGSTDDTFARIQQHAHYHALKQKHNIRMLQQSNHGKGHALRTGILQATQAFVLTLDADMSASPMELQYWMPDETSWQQQVIWIGSRELAASAIKEKPWRKYVGHVFNFMIRALTGLSFRDTQCGFKLYPASVAKQLFEPLFTPGWAHDVEILMRARQAGITVKEMPLQWEARSGSKIRVWKDSFSMLWAVWRIRQTFRTNKSGFNS